MEADTDSLPHRAHATAAVIMTVTLKQTPLNGQHILGRGGAMSILATLRGSVTLSRIPHPIPQHPDSTGDPSRSATPDSYPGIHHKARPMQPAYVEIRSCIGGKQLGRLIYTRCYRPASRSSTSLPLMSMPSYHNALELNPRIDLERVLRYLVSTLSSLAAVHALVIVCKWAYLSLYGHGRLDSRSCHPLHSTRIGELQLEKEQKASKRSARALRDDIRPKKRLPISNGL
ncbi:hypothetical protein BJY04DRAFT_155389 [Aspergillus karnatakaensis]|uniref:uncharacterized protein n=1 Tax=Aspergillus karnatakaensis TaxID=1810916 RepID=UPI003CCCBD97